MESRLVFIANRHPAYDASTLKVLIDAGAEVNAKRSDGASALVLAAATGSTESLN